MPHKSSVQAWFGLYPLLVRQVVLGAGSVARQSGQSAAPRASAEALTEAPTQMPARATRGRAPAVQQSEAEDVSGVLHADGADYVTRLLGQSAAPRASSDKAG